MAWLTFFLKAPQKETMDLVKPDPVDWDIDGVVKFLCYSDPRPWAEGSNIPFPRPTDLATALQENFITGEVLLEEVDKNSLKDDLDVKPLGHRSGIMKAIEWLRNRSAKYQAKHHSSLINGVISPQTELSPKIPTSGVSKSSAPAPEVPPLNVSETAVPSSTMPHGKRRIAPQLVNVIDRNGVPNDTSQTVSGKIPSNKTPRSTKKIHL